MLGNRRLERLCVAPFQPRHYRALFNMARAGNNFREVLRRYLTERGQYPYDLSVRTPIGRFPVRLYNPHDLLTLNEVFFRKDYPTMRNLRVVVDLGSNIGISALYFLTRNQDCRCYLYEPDPRNTAKLRHNLGGLEGRYMLAEKAVAHKAGQVDFGIEPTGRYGGIGAKTGQAITVQCLEINTVLLDVLSKEGRIDILKVDTEGVEIPTVEAIDREMLGRIGRIYVEATPPHRIHAGLFRQRQYGGVCQLIRKAS